MPTLSDVTREAISLRLAVFMGRTRTSEAALQERSCHSAVVSGLSGR